MATKVARPTDKPATAGGIWEQACKLKNQVNLVRIAFDGLGGYHDVSMPGLYDATSAISMQLEDICGRVNRLVEQSRPALSGSQAPMLSAMSEALRLATAEKVDAEYARDAQNTLALLNYSAAVDAEHIALIAGVAADGLKAHVEGRGVPLAPAALKVYAEMRASAAKK